MRELDFCPVAVGEKPSETQVKEADGMRCGGERVETLIFFVLLKYCSSVGGKKWLC